MDTPQRRAIDQRRKERHRTWTELRAHQEGSDQIRCPSWRDQLIQYATRYVFCLMGFLFFQFVGLAETAWWSLAQINTALVVYFVFNTLMLLRARKHTYSPVRFRATMMVDILITSVCFLNDPNLIPPSLLVYLMVVLGNGMRYGMRLFGEILFGSLVAALIVTALRLSTPGFDLTHGVIFQSLFAAVILGYSYILMARIEGSQRQMEASSRFDALTGLLSRRELFRMAEGLFDNLRPSGKKFVVMFADLDNFKQVNDSRGHGVGDEVLRRIAGILRRSVRDTDIVARYGGDEFVLMLEHADLDYAQVVAQRIQRRVSRYAQDEGLPCTISIGMGEAPLHGVSLIEMLDHVDQAMYKSKPREKERRDMTDQEAKVDVLTGSSELEPVPVAIERRCTESGDAS